MNVIVTKYNENWNRMFEDEAQKIKAIFRDELIEIHHIGSTSVPGLQAKPIIDLMPVVKDITRIDSFNEQMKELGYECMGEFGMKGRRILERAEIIEPITCIRFSSITRKIFIVIWQ